MTVENIQQIIKDKEEAWNLCDKLVSRVESKNMGLTEEAYNDLVEHFTFMRWYVKGFRLTARGYCFGRYAVEKNTTDIITEGKNAGELLQKTITDLQDYKNELVKQSFINKYPYDAQLNPERVEYYTNALVGMAAKAGIYDC